MQRKHEQQMIQLGSKASSAAADLSSLEVPQPDVIPTCKAMIGFCQAMVVWMSCTAAIIQRLAHLNQLTSAAEQRKQRLSLEASFAPKQLSCFCLLSRPISVVCATIAMLCVHLVSSTFRLLLCLLAQCHRKSSCFGLLSAGHCSQLCVLYCHMMQAV